MTASLDSVGVMRLVRAAARPSPESSAAEEAVLGALLVDGTALNRVNLRPSDFALEENARVFRAMRACAEDGVVVDVVTVCERLGGAVTPAYLAALAQNAPAVANIDRYADLVRRRASEREKLAALRATAAVADDPALSPDEKVAFARSRLDALTRDAADDALDLEALAGREPERPRHIIDNWLPAGEVSLLAGHGGAGKSAIALHLGACIALGVSWHGIATDQRPVCFLSAEDGAGVLHWRLDRVCRHLGVSIADLARLLTVIDASGTDVELMADVRGDEPVLTPAYEELRDRLRAMPGCVLVIDGASDTFGGNEIIRRHVRRFIRALRRLVDEDGAVLLLTHVDKAIARGRETGDSYSGSTAWHNSVRARWSLRPDGEGLVLALEKANHAKAGAELRLRWSPEAHLYVAEQVPADGGIVASIRERQEREGILAAMRACAAAGSHVPAATTGQRTAYHVLRAQPGFPPSLADDTRPVRGRFWARLEQLRVSGAIAERVIRAGHRHSVPVLELSGGAS